MVFNCCHTCVNDKDFHDCAHYLLFSMLWEIKAIIFFLSPPNMRTKKWTLDLCHMSDSFHIFLSSCTCLQCTVYGQALWTNQCRHRVVPVHIFSSTSLYYYIDMYTIIWYYNDDIILYDNKYLWYTTLWTFFQICKFCLNSTFVGFPFFIFVPLLYLQLC